MALGTGADMAFIVYAMQIDQMNKASNDSLKDVQQTGDLRDAMSKNLSKLRELQSYVNKCADSNGNANVADVVNEYRKFQGKNAIPYNKDDPNWKAAAKEFQEAFPMHKTSYSIGPDGKVNTKQGDQLFKDEGDPGCMFNKDVIKAEVDNIGDDIKQLDADREIKMIMFNGLINKKSNAVSQLTNLIKSNYEMDKSIISNLR